MPSVVRHLLTLCLLLLCTTTCAIHDTDNRATLENSYWKLVELDGDSVVVLDNQQEAHIILHSGNPATMSGSGGCNRLMGSYTLHKNIIDFGNIATTMMACAAGMDTERTLTHRLSGKKYWSIDKDVLTLADEHKKIVARFTVVYLR